jgi:hypothetical protein
MTTVAILIDQPSRLGSDSEKKGRCRGSCCHHLYAAALSWWVRDQSADPVMNPYVRPLCLSIPTESDVDDTIAHGGGPFDQG